MIEISSLIMMVIVACSMRVLEQNDRCSVFGGNT